MKKYIAPVLAVIALLAIGAFGSLAAKINAQVSCPSGTASCEPLQGFAWSSNIGWISFNSDNSGVGGGSSYEVQVGTSSDPNVGTFGGYAWSPNVGWISFNPTDVDATDATNDGITCPNGSCQSAVNLSTGIVGGFARIISMESQPGGGWLELSGTKHLSPATGTFDDAQGNTHLSGGVTYDPATHTFGGFAWEPTAVGWLDFDVAGQGGGSSNSYSSNGYCSGSSCSIPCGNVTLGPCGTQTPPTPSLSFLVNSGGIYGSADNDVTVNSDGTASVGVEWTYSNVANNSCQPQNPTGADWSTVSNIGTIKSDMMGGSNASMSDTLDFSGVSAGQTLNLYMVCQNSNGGAVTAPPIGITFAAGSTPVGACKPAPNSELCIDSSNTGVPVGTLTQTQQACDNPNPDNTYCSYQCLPGYTLKGGSCSKSTTTEF